MDLKKEAGVIIKKMLDCNDFFENNRKYYRVLNDDLSNVLKEDVYSKIKSKSNKKDKEEQSININILQQMVNKKQVYVGPVERIASDNIEAFDYLVEKIKPKTQLIRANDFYNMSKSSLVQVYPSFSKRNKLPAWKVYPNDRYFLHSTNPIDTTIPEVVVLIIDTIQVECENKPGTFIDADLYYMYSEDEMIAIDSTGALHYDKMEENGKNTWGILPFRQFTKDHENLNTQPDNDTLGTILAINDVMTDTKVALHHQSCPLVVGTNIDKKASSIDRNPDSLIILNAKPGSTATPTIEVIAANLDSVKSTDFAATTLSMLLTAHGLVPKSGSANVNKSGLSQTIENTDVTEIRKKQIEEFEPGEEELWEITAHMYNWLLDNRRSQMPKNAPKTKFSDEFMVEVNIGTPDTLLQTELEKEDEDASEDEVKLESQKDVEGSKEESKEVKAKEETKDVDTAKDKD